MSFYSPWCQLQLHVCIQNHKSVSLTRFNLQFQYLNPCCELQGMCWCPFWCFQVCITTSNAWYCWNSPCTNLVLSSLDTSCSRIALWNSGNKERSLCIEVKVPVWMMLLMETRFKRLETLDWNYMKISIFIRCFISFRCQFIQALNDMTSDWEQRYKNAIKLGQIYKTAKDKIWQCQCQHTCM